MNNLRNEYFKWLCACICHDDYDTATYGRLLSYLFSVDYEPRYVMDENRAHDGIGLRYRFAQELNWTYEDVYAEFEQKQCSMLEMMVALSLRFDDEFLYAPMYGHRADQWFWMMISNMGLIYMGDESFDRVTVSSIIKRFLNGSYSRNGEGGLFILNGEENINELDIWSQACRFADQMLLL